MRSRNIKPDFFLNEDLSELDPYARILFIGLWCYADREGRFEWRPKRIKAAIFPYEEIDITCHLMSLHAMTLILQYNIDGDLFGVIPKFKKHQHPHPHEAKSRIPPPPVENSNTSFMCEIPQLNQCHDMSCNVTKCQADIRIPDIINNTPHSPPVKKKRKSNGAHKWPKDFSLTSAMRDYAINHMIDPKKVVLFFEDFKDWAKSKTPEPKYKDWEAAFRTRVNKAPEYGKQFLKKEIPKINIPKPNRINLLADGLKALTTKGKEEFYKFCDLHCLTEQEVKSIYAKAEAERSKN